MLISWNWLKDYVEPTVGHEDATFRWMMAGLNHESTEPAGDDWLIDLEVTNNRPDCLGHIGVARELAVLLNLPLRIPTAKPMESSGEKASDLTSVKIDCPELCPRYIARVIRGVKVGPSPAWMVERLKTIGVASINNVVDITNYVLMECGQPLHAFDFNKLAGQRIQVRRARAGESFHAINHQNYLLDEHMCVIADAERAVALAGVMGGADSEVSSDTTDLLIEAAQFSQLTVRTTARKLKLHSPSSYRFERGLDPEGIDWASRRCCELILELAGGRLAVGSVDVGQKPSPRESVSLRFAQLKRILGIEIPTDRVRTIFNALGCREQECTPTTITLTPPSWRRDLTREIDLVEEAARIHGYDQIPEDASVPMAASVRSPAERVMAEVRRVMTAAGFDEAMTNSVVTPELSDQFSPWTSLDALATNQPMLKGTDRIRRSLIPSLLECRAANEARGNLEAELFETAHLYLPQDAGLPREQATLAGVSGGDFFAAKGVVETLLAELSSPAKLETKPIAQSLFEFGKSVELWVGDQLLGYLGTVSSERARELNLRSTPSVFEINLEMLTPLHQPWPLYQPLSRQPVTTRDVNLIVPEQVRWADLATTITSAAGEPLESLAYRETYRDAAKDGEGKKRLLFTLSFRLKDATLTSEAADTLRDNVVAACSRQHEAVLLAG